MLNLTVLGKIGQTARSYFRENRADYFAFFLVSSFFLSCLAIWCWFDHTVPNFDSAAHALQGYQLLDTANDRAILAKRFWNILTTNFFYPPLAFWFHTLVLATGLPHGLADNVPRFFFFFLAMLALFNLSKQLTNDTGVAVVAVAIFSLYPGLQSIIHTLFMLDMLMAATCYLTLWLLLKWKNSPTFKNATIAGLALGLACLTKQLAALFLLVPVLTLLLITIKNRQWRQLCQLLCTIVVASIIFLAWLLPNFARFSSCISLNQSVESARGTLLSLWLQRIQLYTYVAQLNLTLPLVLAFVASLLDWKLQKKLAFFASFFFGGLGLLCLVNWDHHFRQAFPLLGFMALSTAGLLVALWRSKLIVLRLAVALLVFYDALVFFVVDFTPYPLKAPEWANKIVNPDVIRRTVFMTRLMPSCPSEYYAAAYDWVIEKSLAAPERCFAPINILPESTDFCFLSLKYLLRREGLPPQVGSFRKWTRAGYDFSYSSEDLDQYGWFVDRINQKGPPELDFLNAQARSNYQDLEHSLATSPKYVKVADTPLSDGSTLALYWNTDWHPWNPPPYSK
jgi:4-amino-4-deoxy-L-arabinose transferase-like glycosyltransferase